MAEKKLTAKQRTFLEAYLMNPKLGLKHYAKMLEISYDTVRGWRKNNINGFKDILEEELQERWIEMKEKASDIMFEMAEEKDFRAVKYVLDYSGYGAPQKVEVSSDGGININIIGSKEDADN